MSSMLVQRADRPTVPYIQVTNTRETGSLLPSLETEEELIAQMTTPSEEVKEAVRQLDGDVMILGVAGKMGPTLAELLVKAGAQNVIGVSRFSKAGLKEYLESVGVRTIQCDLLDDKSLQSLPDVPHILLLAGFKFGATGNAPMTWAMNTLVPARVMQQFPSSEIVYVSSGNIYPYTDATGHGAIETEAPDPVGEYANSRLGGERLVQFYAEHNNTPTAIVRLFYATELRYGIILDIAQKVFNGEPINLAMGHVNQIWQGDANDRLARSFPLCSAPANIFNLTGEDVLSVRKIANRLGELLGKEPIFEGEESSVALLGDASIATQTFGPPATTPEQIIEWVAWWVQHDGATLNKPTHYDSRTGKF